MTTNWTGHVKLSAPFEGLTNLLSWLEEWKVAATPSITKDIQGRFTSCSHCTCVMVGTFSLLEMVEGDGSIRVDKLVDCLFCLIASLPCCASRLTRSYIANITCHQCLHSSVVGKWQDSGQTTPNKSSNEQLSPDKSESEPTTATPPPHRITAQNHNLLNNNSTTKHDASMVTRSQRPPHRSHRRCLSYHPRRPLQRCTIGSFKFVQAFAGGGFEFVRTNWWCWGCDGAENGEGWWRCS